MIKWRKRNIKVHIENIQTTVKHVNNEIENTLKKLKLPILKYIKIYKK